MMLATCKIWFSFNRSRGVFKVGKVISNCSVVPKCCRKLCCRDTKTVPKYGGCVLAVNVIFQGRKGQIWSLFTYVSMLFSNIEVLPKFP